MTFTQTACRPGSCGTMSTGCFFSLFCIIYIDLGRLYPFYFDNNKLTFVSSLWPQKGPQVNL
jgi:hypothetical protein